MRNCMPGVAKVKGLWPGNHHRDNGRDVVTRHMKHLANVRRIEGINRTNAGLRLPLIRIYMPEEVIDL
jgi:hypothetical protein